MIAAALAVFVLVGQSNLTRDDGVAVGLAQRWGELTGEQAAIINCAVPDTRLAHWARSWIRTTPYADCMAKIGDAQIRGMAFWNGENDAIQLSWAVTWGRDFMPIAAGFREDLRQNFPIAVAVLQSGCVSDITPHWDRVRALQLNLGGPGVRRVSTDGVNYTDCIHADYQGHVEVGRRFAEALD